MAQTVAITGWSTGLPTILTVVFLVLKLTGEIAWSWWWVLSPIWISWGLSMVFLTIFLVIYLVWLK